MQSPQAEHWRQKAEECEEEAKRAPSPSLVAAWRGLAKQWRAMADRLRKNSSGVRQRLLQFFESALVGRVVAKPFLASSDKRLALSYPGIINSPPQGYGDGVLLRVRYIAFG